MESGGHLDRAARSYGVALSLQPNDPLTAHHLSRVRFLSGDFAGTYRLMDGLSTQIGDDPRLFHVLAMIHHSLDQHDRGDDYFQLSHEAYPEDRWARSADVFYSFSTGRVDRAIDLARTMVDMEPDCYTGLVALADATLAAGDIGGAIPLYERCYSIDPDSRVRGVLRATRTALGFAHLEAGDRSRGEELLAVAEKQAQQALRWGSGSPAWFYELASIYAARGDQQMALNWLERSCQAGWLQHGFLSIDQLFARLRGEPRFSAVEKAMTSTVAEQRVCVS